MSEPIIKRGACNLCEAICGLEFHLTDGEITAIKGDANDPLSRGHICPKAVALKDIYSDPDRLRKPIRRVQTANGYEWNEISWKEALDEVAERLLAVRAEHGANSIGAYLGNPNVHNYGSLTHAAHLFKPLKTKSRFSATSVDQLPHQLIALWMYGHQLLVPIPDIDHTQYFLVLGANPMASNGSLMTVPDFRNRLKALQKRGGKMLVIDPRRSETAEVADEHLFIQPGSDAALLAAILNTLFEEGLSEPGRLAEFSDGLEAVQAAIKPFTPERAATLSGIAADDIRRIAREFAAADSAVCYGRMGVSVQRFGTLCQWLIQLINLVTGNLDAPGGALFTHAAIDLIEGPTSKPGHFNAWQSRVSGRPEFGGELPVSVLAEEITTPGEGQIRALITSAGNPVLSTPNGKQLEAALESLDFMVSIDLYLNETTRFADIILPPTCGLEHDHYDLIFHVFAVRNTAKYSEPLFDKPEGAMHDWEIFTALGERISKALDSRPMPDIKPEQIIDMGLQSGPYSKMAGHPAELSLQKLKDNPAGIDLGPLAPSMPQRLFHADKRIQCAPKELLADLQRLDAELTAPDGNGSLRLIGRRHVRSNNSWMHNYQRLVKGKNRCQLLMHPEDAARLGLDDGQSVKVSSRVGSLTATLSASVEMMPGVVSLPHGWGHTREGIRMGVAREHAGVSVNDLTDTEFFDPLSSNAALNGVEVRVESI